MLKIGTLEEVKTKNSTLPIAEGFPAYFPEARAFVVLMDPSQQRFIPGEDTTGDGRHSTSGRSTSAARTSAASRTRA